MNQTSARLEVKTAEETVARSGFGTWDKENRDSFISKIPCLLRWKCISYGFIIKAPKTVLVAKAPLHTWHWLRREVQESQEWRHRMQAYGEKHERPWAFRNYFFNVFVVETWIFFLEHQKFCLCCSGPIMVSWLLCHMQYGRFWLATAKLQLKQWGSALSCFCQEVTLQIKRRRH